MGLIGAVKAGVRVLGAMATPSASGKSTITELADVADRFITTPDDRRDFALSLYQLGLADVSNARANAGKGSWMLYFLALVIVSGFFGLVYFLTVHGPPANDSTGAVLMLFGSLATAFGSVTQYFFGSSRGSASKDAMTAAHLATYQVPPTPPRRITKQEDEDA